MKEDTTRAWHTSKAVLLSCPIKPSAPRPIPHSLPIFACLALQLVYMCPRRTFRKIHLHPSQKETNGHELRVAVNGTLAPVPRAVACNEASVSAQHELVLVRHHDLWPVPGHSGASLNHCVCFLLSCKTKQMMPALEPQTMTCKTTQQHRLDQ